MIDLALDKEHPKLKPWADLSKCPFCGGDAKFALQGESAEYYVYCGKCYATTEKRKTVFSAARIWNRRSQSDAKDVPRRGPDHE